MKLFVVFHLVIWNILCGVALCNRPASVNIGAVFTFDSVIGRVAKVAMEMAVAEVNADPTVLNGTKLNLIMKDAGCSVFLGSIGGGKHDPEHFVIVYVLFYIFFGFLILMILREVKFFILYDIINLKLDMCNNSFHRKYFR